MVVFCAVMTVHAQENISGKWQGSFDVTASDGSTQHDTAFLILEQRGSEVKGSAGRSEEMQTPLTDGLYRDGTLTFQMNVRGGTVTFHLASAGDHMRGTATGVVPDGTMKAAVDVARVAGGKSKGLREQILAADGALFDAYNRCDIAGFRSWFAADLEFFHDKTGLTDRDWMVKSLEKRCAETTKYHRSIDEESVRVYAVPGYGAMEVGVHRFSEIGADGKEKLDATPGFANVWKQTPEGWKLARVLSYGHQ
jgi:hypothetical protein